MDQVVTKPSYLFPINRRILPTYFVRNLLNGLANDDEVPYDSVLGSFIGEKLLFSKTVRVPQNALTRQANIINERSIVL